MPFIYVIIPVYNAKDYLGEAIKSVLEQPFQAINIILINDGSTDGSSNLCDQLALNNNRITVIHQSNQGVSAARNRGIEYVLGQKSKTKYIAFLDADDLWNKNIITKGLVNELETIHADIVSFSMCFSNSNVSRIHVKEIHKKELIELQEPFQIKRNIRVRGSFAAHLYRVDLFEDKENMFDEKCRMNEDMIFLEGMFFCSKRFLFYDKCLYIYRKNRKSVTNSNNYNLRNATHIPEAWLNAINRFDKKQHIPKKNICAWKEFCLSVSSLKCLEIIGLLAKNGYSKEQIQDCFDKKIYYLTIKNVAEEMVEEWQKKDFLLFKRGFEEYYCFYRRQKWKYYIRKKLSTLKVVQIIWDVLYYELPIKEIENNESVNV